MTKQFKIILAVILGLGVIGIWASHIGYQRVDNFTSIAKYTKHLKKEFDEIEHISTSSLATLIKARDAGLETLYLIDCREPEEFSISHIKGAVNLDTPEAVLEYIKSQEQTDDANVVTYCSVGYRSSILAEELKNRGLEEVKNVEGSIFKWANEDRPLVDSGGNPTDKVHPFNTFWKRHLDEGKAADVELDE